MNRYFVLFILFSFLGWVWESIYCTACQKKWQNRGFLYGPVCPIYGFGGIVGLMALDFVTIEILPELSWWQIFLAGFILSMILEYPTSWFLEKLFHARWWDYSKVPLNINGRTSVPTSLAFGAAAILAMKILIPFADNILHIFPHWAINLMALLSIAVLSADVTLTVSALTDFQKRVTQIDDAFQNHMTEVVEQLVVKQNFLYNNAIKRISKIKLPESKLHIAERLRDLERNRK